MSVVKVLIVDDQAPFRNVAKTVVKLTPGFEVVGEAESGEQGVELAKELGPDLVLMDINLPGINGIEAVRQIVQEAPASRAILLSTYQAEDLPADAKDSGAIAYIHKEDFDPLLLRDIWDKRENSSWHA
jgi:two-component system, NarL family, invasion response regulator UvrY